MEFLLNLSPDLFSFSICTVCFFLSSLSWLRCRGFCWLVLWLVSRFDEIITRSKVGWFCSLLRSPPVSSGLLLLLVLFNGCCVCCGLFSGIVHKYFRCGLPLSSFIIKVHTIEDLPWSLLQKYCIDSLFFATTLSFSRFAFDTHFEMNDTAGTFFLFHFPSCNYRLLFRLAVCFTPWKIMQRDDDNII